MWWRNIQLWNSKLEVNHCYCQGYCHHHHDCNCVMRGGRQDKKDKKGRLADWRCKNWINFHPMHHLTLVLRIIIIVIISQNHHHRHYLTLVLRIIIVSHYLTSPSSSHTSSQNHHHRRLRPFIIIMHIIHIISTLPPTITLVFITLSLLQNHLGGGLA